MRAQPTSFRRNVRQLPSMLRRRRLWADQLYNSLCRSISNRDDMHTETALDLSAEWSDYDIGNQSTEIKR
ncbi:MAG: hypothetical protein EOS61_28240 [Mesorhizobium sp.]|nr:MAG: hypothetical protein EOQ57_35650 [Mesorhizobium sp.]RWE02027.1 MAG: hypothetical protein EOS61_28240 [Mesorhizobium sp.]TIS44342.1 MAG: hypothetical protein E5W96_36755 [Mesorhizobium sp.]